MYQMTSENQGFVGLEHAHLHPGDQGISEPVAACLFSGSLGNSVEAVLWVVS